MKKWLIAVLCVVLCLLLATGAVNFLVDPLMQYRPLNPALTFVAYDYDYINPGLAKNSVYDGVLVGTSLAENTDMDRCETYFGMPMIKLIYPGGTSRNNREILDVAFRGRELKTVLWIIDDTLFFNESSELSHELPTYLYDDRPLNDVSYLLNLSVLYNYTFKDVLNSLKGMSTPPLLRGETWALSDKFGKEAVMAVQSKDPEQVPEKDETFYQACLTGNLEHNVFPLLEAHPDTQFYFFFPPKCITYWRNAQRSGVFEAKFYAMQYLVDALMQHDNARVYFFADRMEWSTDLSLWKDNIHFKPLVNDKMCEEMAQGVGELTAETAAARIRALHDTLKNADYSQWLDDE